MLLLDLTLPMCVWLSPARSSRQPDTEKNSQARPAEGALGATSLY